MPWLLIASCGSGLNAHDTSVAEHKRMARHYEATAESIEAECFKARRNELAVGDPSPCWKAQDKRFLEANRNAAAKHRAAATRLQAAEARASAAASR